jgi:hypothetical protein
MTKETPEKTYLIGIEDLIRVGSDEAESQEEAEELARMRINEGEESVVQMKTLDVIE